MSNVMVQFGGDASALQAAARVAQAELQNFERQARGLAASLAKTADPIKFASLTTATSQIQETKSRLDSLKAAAEQATGGMHNLSFASAGVTRELIVLAHEGLVMGNWSRLGGSVMVLAERMGGLHGILGGVTSGMVAAGAEAAVAAAGIAYIGYQAYETDKNLRSMQANLLLTGRAGLGEGLSSVSLGGAPAELSAMAGKISEELAMSRKEASQLLAEISKAPGPTKEQVLALSEVAAEIAFVKKQAGETVDYEKIGESVASAAAKGSKGLIELAGHLNVAATSAQQMLKNGDEAGAFQSAIDAIKSRVDGLISSEVVAKARWLELQSSVSQYALEGVGYAPPDIASQAPSVMTPPIGAHDIPGATPQESALLAEIRRRESAGIYNQLHATHAQVSSLADVEGVRGIKSHAFGGYGFQPGTYRDMSAITGVDPNDISPPAQDKNALALLRKYGPNAKQSWQESGPYSGSYNYGQSAEAIEAQNQAQSKAAERNFAKAEGMNRHSLEVQTEDARKHYDEVKALADRGIGGQDDVTKAANTWTDRRRALYEAQTEEQIAPLRSQQSAAPTAAIRAQMQAQMNAIQEARGKQEEDFGLVSPGAGLDPRKRAEGDRELNIFKYRAYQEDTANLLAAQRDKIAGTSDYSKKMAALQVYEGLQQTRAAVSPMFPGVIDPRDIARNNMEMTNYQREQLQHNFSSSEQDYAGLKQRNDLTLRANQSVQGVRVDTGQESAVQAAQTQVDLIRQQAAGELEALQNLLKLAQASNDDAAAKRVGLQILEQQVSTTEKLLEAQKKIADAKEKLTEAWGAPFKSAIDEVGGGLERGLSGIITARNPRDRTQALHGVYTSEINSGLNLAEGVGSKGIASLLGAQGGKGLGDFLGDKAVSLLGIGKGIDKDAMTAANTGALTALTTVVGENTIALGGVTTTAAGSAGTSALSGAGSAGGLLGGISTAYNWITGAGAAGGIGGWGAVVGTAGLSRGGIVAASAGGWKVPASAGGWKLPGFGSDTVPAMLTPGETVLPVGERPSHIANAVQNMVGALMRNNNSGGDTNHLHFHGPSDGPSIDKWFQNTFKRNSHLVGKALKPGGGAKF